MERGLIVVPIGPLQSNMYIITGPSGIFIIDPSVSLQATEDFLIDYYDEQDIPIIQHCLGTLHDALNETECLKVNSREDSTLNLIIMDGKYFLNVRKTTIALIGLVLDIAFAKGFASFVLAVFGLNAAKIRKLEYSEKRVLLYVQAEKINFDPDKNEFVIHGDINYEFEAEQLKTIIEKLLEDEIISRKGNFLKINF